MAFLLSFAILAVVLQVSSDSMGPAVRDMGSVGIGALGNKGLARISVSGNLSSGGGSGMFG